MQLSTFPKLVQASRAYPVEVIAQGGVVVYAGGSLSDGQRLTISQPTFFSSPSGAWLHTAPVDPDLTARLSDDPSDAGKAIDKYTGQPIPIGTGYSVQNSDASWASTAFGKGEGATVTFEPGVYTLTPTVTVMQNQTWIADGCTFVAAVEGTTNSDFSIFRPSGNWELVGATVVGPTSIGSGGFVHACQPVNAATSGKTVYRRVTVKQASTSFRLASSLPATYSFEAYNCRFEGRTSGNGIGSTILMSHADPAQKGGSCKLRDCDFVGFGNPATALQHALYIYDNIAIDAADCRFTGGVGSGFIIQSYSGAAAFQRSHSYRGCVLDTGTNDDLRCIVMQSGTSVLDGCEFKGTGPLGDLWNGKATFSRCVLTTGRTGLDGQTSAGTGELIFQDSALAPVGITFAVLGNASGKLRFRRNRISMAAASCLANITNGTEFEFSDNVVAANGNGSISQVLRSGGNVSGKVSMNRNEFDVGSKPLIYQASGQWGSWEAMGNISRGGDAGPYLAGTASTRILIKDNWQDNGTDLVAGGYYSW